MSSGEKGFTLVELIAVLMVFAVGPRTYADRESIVTLLRQQESLIQSATAWVHVKYTPTDPGRIEDIEAENTRLGEPVGSYVKSPESAERSSFSAEWRRKGPMERFDRYPHQTRDVLLSTVAFDGNIHRRLSAQDGELYGFINSRETSHWDATNRPYPFGFLFEYQTTPYSDIVERATEYLEEEVTENGEIHTKVTVRHPDIEYIGFELTWDSRGRLVNRLTKIETPSRKDEGLVPRVRHRFFDYEEIDVGDGNNVLWFPKRAVYHSYWGVNDEGVPNEFMSKEIIIEDLRVNIDIPSDIFVLEFPEGASIYDGRTRPRNVE